ncbi:hypothetical protein NDR89_20480 [Cupriavidus gilardii]|uniref:Uncharacterized protein n=1 Tax=Cupriavidus gilardii TaxID=82541 RepID=A0ABY4VPQ4_9BURK|nr:hypothetical protein [Cupriavidus gilardii]USE79016.1 hypothetical protein NDR89_20480 [Cupriavidus gilardii]
MQARHRHFTAAQTEVAEQIQRDPLNFANDNDIEAGAYMAPVAGLVLRGDLSDAALLSMAREILQQYERDTRHHVALIDEAAAADEQEALALRAMHIRSLPDSLLSRNGAIA